MKTVICDICGKRKADRHFKVKEQKAYAEMDEHGFIHRALYWEHLDICKTCYEAFINLRKGVIK